MKRLIDNAYALRIFHLGLAATIIISLGALIMLGKLVKALSNGASSYISAEFPWGASFRKAPTSLAKTTRSHQAAENGRHSPDRLFVSAKFRSQIK